MNERIKELAEQCGFRSNPDIYDRNQSFDIGRFAELIVRECITQCEQVATDADAMAKSKFVTDSGRMLHEGMWGGAKNCGGQIKQHFGVEE